MTFSSRSLSAWTGRKQNMYHSRANHTLWHIKRLILWVQVYLGAEKIRWLEVTELEQGGGFPKRVGEYSTLRDQGQE